MRVLWLSPYPPEPPFHGGRIRLLNLIRATVKQGHEVDLWCMDETEEASAQLEGVGASIRRLTPRKRTGAAAKALAMLNGLPEEAWSANTPALARAIAELRPGVYDVAVLEQAHMGARATALLNRGIPVVLDAQNVEAALVAELGRHADRARARARARADSLKYRRLERRLFSGVATVVAASEIERERILSRAPEANVAVAPNGVDTTYFKWHDHTQPNQARMVMTGTLGYPPNLDAAMWLHDQVLPSIRGRLPTAAVKLVGYGAPPELCRLHDPSSGFLVEGAVPDVRPFMAEADVFVLPMRLGRGIRLKALEALASGLPLVSTPLGVEGVGLRDGREVLIAENPEDFSRLVAAALEDLDLRRTLVRGGRKFAVERFDWQRIGRGFVSTLEHAARSGTALL